MKNCVFCLFALASFFVDAQNVEFGKISQADYDLKTYGKDTTANAVVLYERGNYYFDIVDRSILLVKEYHIRIKILNEKGVDEATISIPYFRNKTSEEEFKTFEAVTHNGTQKKYVTQDKIYNLKVNENMSERRFTFADVGPSSIIEYKYKLVSPFYFKFDGWTFQSHIPKIYSEFHAKIPFNYVYNRSLYGALYLKQRNSIERNCFKVPGFVKAGSCEILQYSMQDIPAIEKNEKYMLAESNYISRIEFELSEIHRFSGARETFSQSWKDIDSDFKKDKDIGRQLRKKDFFEKNVPQEIFKSEDSLTKAKNIYKFVRNHFAWNKKYGIYRNSRVKDAFHNKSGNIAEINMSLINLLNAGGIKADLMLLSIRDYGLPKKVYPVITDFNYVVAKTTINGKDYLLDASSKTNPFGMLPFHCLNHYGRVMDFDNESYWFDIVPEKVNRTQIMGMSHFDLGEGMMKGKFRQINQGYNAISSHEKISSKSEEEYLDELQGNASPGFYIEDYTFQKEKSHEKKTMEVFEFSIEDYDLKESFFFNPLLVKFFKQNPFLREKRRFPVDFGYPRQHEYNMTFTIPEAYEVENLPEAKSIALSDNGGTIQFSCSTQEKSIRVRYIVNINKTHFASEVYHELKKFFEIAVDIEQNSIIKLKKT